jgi:hypothetical protein
MPNVKLVVMYPRPKDIAAFEKFETVERVHRLYAMRCPLYRTLHNAIQLTSSFTLERQEA